MEPQTHVIISALEVAGYYFNSSDSEADKWLDFEKGYKKLKASPKSQKSTSCYLSSPTSDSVNRHLVAKSGESLEDSLQIKKEASLELCHKYIIDGQPISDVIKSRIKEHNGGFFCNENISSFLKDGELEMLVNEVSTKFQGVLESLVINTKDDHNTRDTAHRVAKMYVKEIFSGRFEKPPKVTAFPNYLHYDQMYVTGPITVKSMCAHHMMPIQGSCFVGVFPNKKVIGLSKFNRIVEWICSRPQIQEEMTIQVAQEIQKVTETESIAVLIRAEHECMTMRGVRAHESDMTTSIMKGKFNNEPSSRSEFLQYVSQMKS